MIFPNEPLSILFFLKWEKTYSVIDGFEGMFRM